MEIRFIVENIDKFNFFFRKEELEEDNNEAEKKQSDY